MFSVWVCVPPSFSGPTDVTLSGVDSLNLTVSGLHIDEVVGSPTYFHFLLTVTDYRNLTDTSKVQVTFRKGMSTYMCHYINNVHTLPHLHTVWMFPLTFVIDFCPSLLAMQTLTFLPWLWLVLTSTSPCLSQLWSWTVLVVMTTLVSSHTSGAGQRTAQLLGWAFCCHACCSWLSCISYSV